MRTRGWIAILPVLVGLGLFAAFAVAASPHFKHGGEPTCADTGEQLACTGSLTGLGNQDLQIDLTSDAIASFECVNKGGNAAPGQNKIPFVASGDQTISADEIKNGNATFNVVAPENPPTATPEQAGCPNAKTWTTARLTGVDFSNVRLDIIQGSLLFHCTYPGDVPTSGRISLSC